jgi:TonB family protein
MNTHLLLSAAALILAASAAVAGPSESERYASKAVARADALARQTGVDFKAQPVSVRAAVDVDGRVRSVQVVRSSGSTVADRAAEAILRKLVVADPPTGLSDGAVTLNLGPAKGPAEKHAGL